MPPTHIRSILQINNRCHCEPRDRRGAAISNQELMERVSHQASNVLCFNNFMDDAYFVYILTNRYHTVLYTGVTSDLYNRVLEHKSKAYPGFTARYNVNKLVYYEQYGYIFDAIEREKQIKAGSRKKKIDLINSLNPGWEDLWEKEFGQEAD